jgi:hypothetical protein
MAWCHALVSQLDVVLWGIPDFDSSYMLGV